MKSKSFELLTSIFEIWNYDIIYCKVNIQSTAILFTDILINHKDVKLNCNL